MVYKIKILEKNILKVGGGTIRLRNYALTALEFVNYIILLNSILSTKVINIRSSASKYKISDPSGLDSSESSSPEKFMQLPESSSV